MLDREFTVRFITYKNCFIYFSEKNLRKITQRTVLKLSYGDNQTAYFSCDPNAYPLNENCVGINHQLAKQLGIKEHDTVHISAITRIAAGLSRISVMPLTKDDYDILVLSSSTIQSVVLKQIRIVNKNQKFLIWISNSLYIAVKTETCEPTSLGRLCELTEVVVISPDAPSASPSPSISSITSQTELTRTSPSISRPICRPEKSMTKADPVVEFLKKFSNQWLSSRVFRVNVLNLGESKGAIFKEPFCAFLHKSSIPSCFHGQTSSVLLARIGKIDLPVILKDAAFVFEKSKSLIVELRFIEDVWDDLDDSEKINFSVVVGSKNVLFVSKFVINYLALDLGTKIIAEPDVKEAQEISHLDLMIKQKNSHNYEVLFRNFIRDLMPDTNSTVLLNNNFCVKMDDVEIMVQLPDGLDYCIVDRFMLRNLKINVVESDEVICPKEIEWKSSLENFDYGVEIPSFAEVIRHGERVLEMNFCTDNSWENILLYGKTGSGKSHIVRQICKGFSDAPTHVFVTIISCKQLRGKTAESLNKVLSHHFMSALFYQPSVIIFDDIHIICGRGNDSVEAQSQESTYFNRISEMIDEIIKVFTKDHCISVIATCESPSKLNETLSPSRGNYLFKNILNMPELSKLDRSVLFDKLFSRKANVSSQNWSAFLDKSDGFVVQDVADFVDKAAFESLKRQVSGGVKDKALTVEDSDLDESFSKMTALSLKDVKFHSAGKKTFDDVGGLDDAKITLVEIMKWPAMYPQLFEKAPLRLQTGVLLYGPPGTGKTLLVGAAAVHFGIRLISVKGPELLSKYIGASEQAVRDTFEKAQSAKPCILFFDEFDSLAPRRGHDNTGVTDRVVNQFLTQLDGIETLTGVFVVAATSRPDLLDPALLRPGRLDKQIFCPLPEQATRLAILKSLSKSMNLEDGVDLAPICNNTDGFSGADLQAVLFTAQLAAVEEILDGDKVKEGAVAVIKQSHLEEALRNTRPSLSRQEKLKYQYIYTKFQSGAAPDLNSLPQKATLA